MWKSKDFIWKSEGFVFFHDIPLFWIYNGQRLGNYIVIIIESVFLPFQPPITNWVLRKSYCTTCFTFFWPNNIFPPQELLYINLVNSLVM